MAFGVGLGSLALALGLWPWAFGLGPLGLSGVWAFGVGVEDLLAGCAGWDIGRVVEGILGECTFAVSALIGLALGRGGVSCSLGLAAWPWDFMTSAR